MARIKRVISIRRQQLTLTNREGPEGKEKVRFEDASARSDQIGADVTKNVFYWSRVAVIVAQGSGMHRRLVALHNWHCFG